MEQTSSSTQNFLLLLAIRAMPWVLWDIKVIQLHQDANLRMKRQRELPLHPHFVMEVHQCLRVAFPTAKVMEER
eukprot:10374342-Ditylum_brightwellii.AAC.1